MKLTLVQRKQEDIEVEIRYREMNSYVEELVKKIESFNHTIFGDDNGRQYKINVCDIYYIESVDKKTFIYTKEQVFRSELKLYQLFNELADYDFVQINKACILNINVLESLQPLVNSRIEAKLSNGERLNVSRTYIPDIKKALTVERNTSK
ncbi:LytTR family DNA-binding domain-containing protein [Acetivibrio cellulolyticus]|uniref:LytTR family DNA-binding domain-containing protein n=1 Tax=Acetivibrio cellulolyticus TaxID=35830 RepID=UPI0001E2C2DC|nr:LytTR family DNA-binding domain-containing protein [Acetivibrio cellulolyticus]